MEKKFIGFINQRLFLCVFILFISQGCVNYLSIGYYGNDNKWTLFALDTLNKRFCYSLAKDFLLGQGMISTGQIRMSKDTLFLTSDINNFSLPILVSAQKKDLPLNKSKIVFVYEPDDTIAFNIAAHESNRNHQLSLVINHFDTIKPPIPDSIILDGPVSDLKLIGTLNWGLETYATEVWENRDLSNHFTVYYRHFLLSGIYQAISDTVLINKKSIYWPSINVKLQKTGIRRIMGTQPNCHCWDKSLWRYPQIPPKIGFL